MTFTPGEIVLGMFTGILSTYIAVIGLQTYNNNFKVAESTRACESARSNVERNSHFGHASDELIALKNAACGNKDIQVAKRDAEAVTAEKDIAGVKTGLQNTMAMVKNFSSEQDGAASAVVVTVKAEVKEIAK